jgi:nitroreductase
MTGEELSDDDMMSLFEAARWAPSSSNNQPWRFIYAKRNTEYWDKLFNLMVEGNKLWAKTAALLVVVISRKNFEHNKKPSKTYQYEAGSAWENLALEATSRGLSAHGMAGFDYEKARTDLNIPDNFDVMAMIAIGKIGPICHRSFKKKSIQTIENLYQKLQWRESLESRLLFRI